MAKRSIAEYDAIAPHRFGVVERLQLSIADATRYPASGLDLILELRPFDSNNESRLVLRFRTVQQLRIVQPWMTMFQIGGLRIRSTEKDQLEGVNLHVSEPEHDSLSFVCEDFEFELSENSPAH